MADGTDYELLVKAAYESLIQEGVHVHHLKSYVGRRTGQPYVIDLSYEFQFAGVEFLVLLECKSLDRRVEVGEILEFAQKVDDIGGHKGVFISRNGFQEGAVRVARSYGIALMVFPRISSPDDNGASDEPFLEIIRFSGNQHLYDWAFEGLSALAREGHGLPIVAIESEDGGMGALISRVWMEATRDKLPAQSIADADTALYHFGRLMRHYRNAYELDFANCLLARGRAYCKQNSMESALEDFESASKLARAMTKKGGGERSLVVFAVALHNKACLNLHEKRYGPAHGDLKTVHAVLDYLVNTRGHAELHANLSQAAQDLAVAVRSLGQE
jgi:hypothetical protein